MRAATSATLCIALAALAPAAAQAGSSSDTNNPYTLNQDLTFRVLYPRFLRFRVGSPGAGAVDTIVFSPTVATLGSATPLLGIGGDAGTSIANVEVVGNNGQITITPTNNSAGLGLGTGSAADGYIAYSEIQTLSSNASLPAPVLSNAGGTASQPVLNATAVTQRTAQWTYRYLNASVPSVGTYGSGGGTGGRVTYTATMP